MIVRALAVARLAIVVWHESALLRTRRVEGSGVIAPGAMTRAAALVVIVAITVATPATAKAAATASDLKPTRATAWIARLVAPVTARGRPGGDRVLARVPAVAPWNEGPMGLLVLGARAAPDGSDWLRVRLPGRPNGATGWVPRQRVALRSTPYRVTVDRRSRRVRLLRSGRVVGSTRAVIGAPGTPTPRGLFAIAERVRQPNPHSFLGPWALHLTAFSDVLDDFGGGPGRVGLHGRDGLSLLDPLGSARSHGCVRVPDAFIARLARVARAGTPVRIV